MTLDYAAIAESERVLRAARADKALAAGQIRKAEADMDRATWSAIAQWAADRRYSPRIQLLEEMARNAARVAAAAMRTHIAHPDDKPRGVRAAGLTAIARSLAIKADIAASTRTHVDAYLSAMTEAAHPRQARAA